MQSFSFMSAADIRFGRGVAAGCVSEIADLGTNILLVHGSASRRSAWLEKALEENGCIVCGYAVASEPDMAMIEDGVAAARSQGANLVCAIGGGAVIDAGKAIAALVPSSRPILDHLEVVGKGLPLEDEPLPFVALPTTSGTGAEVTKNAVISVPEHRRKVSLRDAKMLANLAIIDPSLTDQCPRNITLTSGLDAITQLIEPFVCTRANAMSDALCRDAIPRGLSALRKLMEGEHETARDEMAWVSLCGGLALANAGLGAVHGLAGPLGGVSNAPHGALCGVLLPHVMKANHTRCNDPVVLRKFDEIGDWISDAFGTRKSKGLAVEVERLSDWSRNCGLKGLDELGVHVHDRSAVAKAAASSSSMKVNPVVLTALDLETIMAEAA